MPIHSKHPPSLRTLASHRVNWTRRPTQISRIHIPTRPRTLRRASRNSQTSSQTAPNAMHARSILSQLVSGTALPRRETFLALEDTQNYVGQQLANRIDEYFSHHSKHERRIIHLTVLILRVQNDDNWMRWVGNLSRAFTLMGQAYPDPAAWRFEQRHLHSSVDQRVIDKVVNTCRWNHHVFISIPDHKQDRGALCRRLRNVLRNAA